MIVSRICATQKSTPLSSCVLTDQRTKGNQSWTSWHVVVDCRKKQCVVLDVFNWKCTERPEVPAIGNKCTRFYETCKQTNKRVWIAFCSPALLARSLCLPQFSVPCGCQLSTFCHLPASIFYELVPPPAPPPGPWSDGFCGLWIIV